MGYPYPHRAYIQVGGEGQKKKKLKIHDERNKTNKAREGGSGVLGKGVCVCVYLFVVIWGSHGSLSDK